ncbi:uncharacterized protein LOC127760320 [Oryza glaberrima]|uniref:uncharacterized protein LOC127760320 n=1 Tax=Oryza glaberrima TaxID=4538 RepID=UPI00224C4CDA|nr:uncharacterized protein LOC127760320 [Oryza glaberrima]
MVSLHPKLSPHKNPIPLCLFSSSAFHRTPCDHSLTTARDHHCEALRPELEVGGSGGRATLPPSPLGRLDAKERRRTPSGAINTVCLCSTTWNFVVPPFLGHLFDGMQQKEATFSQIALAPTLLGGREYYTIHMHLLGAIKRCNFIQHTVTTIRLNLVLHDGAFANLNL